MSSNYEKIKSLVKTQENGQIDCVDEFNLRSALRDLKLGIQEFNDSTLKLDEVQKKINIIEENPSCELYLSVSDRQVLDWHFANLEFANATPLSELSLKHWDQDDEFEFAGSHMTG